MVCYINLLNRIVMRGGAPGVMVIVIGNGHADKSSNPCISQSTNTLILPPAMGKIVGQTRFFSVSEVTSLGEGKL